MKRSLFRYFALSCIATITVFTLSSFVTEEIHYVPAGMEIEGLGCYIPLLVDCPNPTPERPQKVVCQFTGVLWRSVHL